MTELVGKSLRGRLPYTPIHRRAALKLPNNARVAVWTIVNVENWSPTGAMPRGVAAADGTAAASGRSELGLARIRNARRLLAFHRDARQPKI
jgi:hypothetical protein